MEAFVSQLHRSKVLVLIYLLGLLFQAIYVPFQARESSNIFIAAHEAGYSWVWDRPIYYDAEKNSNISLAESETRREKSVSPSNFFAKYLPGESALPSSWIPIYGIDYIRLLLTLGLWTVVMGGIYFVLKKKET